jgi:hypothetical protein
METLRTEAGAHVNSVSRNILTLVNSDITMLADTPLAPLCSTERTFTREGSCYTDLEFQTMMWISYKTGKSYYIENIYKVRLHVVDLWTGVLQALAPNPHTNRLTLIQIS